MRYKLTFVTGFASGYLLGSRAGRARYEEIMGKLRGLTENPTVQETAGVVQAQASDLANTAKRAVTEKVDGVKDKVGASGGGGSASSSSAPTTGGSLSGSTTADSLATSPAGMTGEAAMGPGGQTVDLTAAPNDVLATEGPIPGATESRSTLT